MWLLVGFISIILFCIGGYFGLKAELFSKIAARQDRIADSGFIRTMRTFFALRLLLASILVIPSFSWAASWQLQNMSKEHREIFLYLPGSKKPQTKVVPPHTSVTIPGTTGLEVVDGMTGQKLVNPQGKNMWITPEGHIRMR